MDAYQIAAGASPGNTTTEDVDQAAQLAELQAQLADLTARIATPRLGARAAAPSVKAIRARSREGGSMRGVEFTKRTLEALEAPAKGESFAWAASPKGFGVRVSASGKRSFIVQYRIKGELKSRRHTIGDASGTGIAERIERAERRARAILDRAREGGDLLIEEAAERERQKAEAEQTTTRSVGAVVEGYLAEADVRARRSYDQTARYLRVHWKPIHGASAEAVSRHDLAAVLDQIARERGRVSANRAQSAISAMFAHAMVAGVTVKRDDGASEFVMLRREVSPAALLRKRPERSRERTLSLDELGRLWRGVEAVDRDLRTVARLLILTGCRLREIGELRWSEVDLDAAEIRLPASRTKNARPHAIPLPPVAVDMLAEVERTSSPLVFASRSWGWGKDAIDKKVKLEAPWTYHDLRRSLSSGMREHGVADGHLVELIINHTSGSRGGVAGVYDRSERMAERRRALERWAEMVQRAAGENVAGAKVVAIR